MSHINLSKRLGAIASLVPQNGGVADVGTDHGFLPVWLLKRGFEGYMAATDINPGPLGRAGLTAEEHGLSDKIDFILCDGLSAVDEELVSTIIIAGMGGETISGILQNAPWTSGKLLILQPMSKSERLREWLFENGYCVLAESLVLDGTVYEIISATGGTDAPYIEGEALTGRFSLISGNPLFPRRLGGLIEKTERALEGLKGASITVIDSRKEKLKKTLDGLLEMRARL